MRKREEDHEWLYALAIALAFLIFLSVRHSHAHAAPSGWHYPSDCCDQGDCKPVQCDSITEKKDGYEWHGILFSENKVRPSGDKTCHVCIGKEWSPDGKTSKDKFPHCIFIQPNT